MLIPTLQFLVAGIQESLFYSSLISKLFLAKNEEKAKKEPLQPTIREETNVHQETTFSSFSKLPVDPLLEYLLSLRKAAFSCRDKVNLFVMQGFCCLLRKRTKLELIYESGQRRLNRAFSITRVLTKLERMNLFEHIFLSKYQKRFLPFFRSNVLDGRVLSNESSSQEEVPPEILALYLDQLALQSSKVDKRIMKMINPTT